MTDSTPAPRSRSLLRSRSARWAVPALALAAVGGGLLVNSVVADAATQLPPKTAGRLLADIAEAPERPFSGTVVETAKLGLPELPGGSGSTSLQSLITGSHTARVWYGADDKARFSLVGDLAETDVVRNGDDVWLWSSSENKAVHYRVPADADRAKRDRSALPSGAPTTPEAAAEQALRAIDPTTTVTVDGTSKVAGRSAYELRLEPKDARSLIGSVRLAVDGSTSVPLRVQVFAKGAQEPAFETGFTAVQFEDPADSVFTFTPPAGAKVEQGTLPSFPAGAAGSLPPAARDRAAESGAPTVVGKGWTSVAVVRGVDLSAVGQDETAAAVLRATSTVTGSYGTGRLLRTPLVSALVVGDTAYVGAVAPAVLEEAAASSSPTR